MRKQIKKLKTNLKSDLKYRDKPYVNSARQPHVNSARQPYVNSARQMSSRTDCYQMSNDFINLQSHKSQEKSYATKNNSKKNLSKNISQNLAAKCALLTEHTNSLTKELKFCFHIIENFKAAKDELQQKDLTLSYTTREFQNNINNHKEPIDITWTPCKENKLVNDNKLILNSERRYNKFGNKDNENREIEENIETKIELNCSDIKNSFYSSSQKGDIKAANVEYNINYHKNILRNLLDATTLTCLAEPNDFLPFICSQATYVEKLINEVENFKNQRPVKKKNNRSSAEKFYDSEKQESFRIPP